MFKGFVSRLARRLCKVAAFTVIFIALLLNAAHFLVNLLPGKADLIAAVASTALKQSVSVKSAYLKGSILSPVLVLKGVSLKQSVRQAPYISDLTVTLDVIQSLLHGRWLTKQVTLQDLHLTLATNQAGHLIIKGLPKISGKKSPQDNMFVDWLMSQPSVGCKDLTIQWVPKSPKHSSAWQIDALLLRAGNQHHFAIDGYAQKKPQEKIIVKGAFGGAGRHIWDDQWRLYVDMKAVPVVRWLTDLPASFQPKWINSLRSGQLSATAWATIQNNRLITSYATFTLQNILMKQKGALHGIWVSGLQGQSFASQTEGRVRLFSDNMQIAPLALYSHDFKQVALKTDFQWKNKADKMAIDLHQFSLKRAPFSLEAKGGIEVPWSGALKLRLAGQMAFHHLKKLPQFLPDRIIPFHLQQWLDQAVKRGGVEHVRWLFHGEPSEFPFARHQGHFEVFAHMKQGVLQFSKHWPAVKNLDARLDFDNQGLLITANHAMMGQLKLQAIRASIANLAQPTLKVASTIKSTVPGVLSYVQKTPLPVGRDLKNLAGSGDIDSHFSLQLPLFGAKRQLKTKGDITFVDDHLSFGHVPIVLNHFCGVLSLQNGDVLESHFNADLFKAPLSMQLLTKHENKDHSALFVGVHGILPVDKLLGHFSSQYQTLAIGQTPFKGRLVLHDVKSGEPNQLRFESSLRGVNLDGWPAPFDKKTQIKRPLKISASFFPKRRLDAHISLANQLYSEMRWQYHLHNHQWQLGSGSLYFGRGPWPVKSKNGVFIGGYLASFNVDDWKHFVSGVGLFSLEKNANQLFTLPAWLRRIDLTIGKVRIGQNVWHDTYLQVYPVQVGAVLACQNAFISGKVLFPNSASLPISARFQYAFLKQSKQGGLQLDPSKVPSFDLNIDDLRLDKRLDGSIQLAAEHRKNGLDVKRLIVHAPYFSLSAKGLWEKGAGKESVQLNGELTSENLGKLLLNRQLSSRLEGGKLDAQFTLAWPGMPTDFSLKQVKGSVGLNCKNGRILRLDAKTESNVDLGRLLNLLSLESISKFISLDFSDFTNEGFFFHRFAGHFRLHEGMITTDDANIDSSVAKVDMKGTIGLVHRASDITMTVTPEISSSLPFIIGMAGGPIAGIATWVANKVLSPGVGRIMRVTYHVGGDWHHPLVKKLS